MRQVLMFGVLLLLCADSTLAHRRKSSSSHSRKHSKARPSSDEGEDDAEAKTDAKPDDLVRLTLVDGTVVIVDDAGENEQGYWYQRSGVTHLIPRDRVKSISHPRTAKQTVVPQVAKVAVVNAAPTEVAAQPVWIYLLGGARVEADNAEESAAGVWYRRGPLAIFIERSRIERIEREDPERAAQSASNTKERGWTTGNGKIDSLVKQSGTRYGVDPYLIFCVMEQESHFSTHAVSPKGARGLMQLMPGTGARFGVRHPFNPGENIAAGARYLKQLMTQFGGRVDLVLASYNAGEGAVIKFGHKVPPYRETRDYVRRISYRYQRARVPVKRVSAPGGQPPIGN
jgi:soluble lytic murein transglycosylase-like protein